MATTDMNAQIHIKDGNGNVNNIFPATKIANVEGLQTALNAKANSSDVTSGLAGKVDKETGKGLSTNDYTTTEKNKLAGIEAQANKTVVDSALSSSSENPVQNKIVKTALDTKANTSDVTTALSSKADSSTVSSLSTRLSDVETEQTTLDARMDTFTNLAEGSTTGDAELTDIRVKADGTTATNAGNAVREQVTALKNSTYVLTDGEVMQTTPNTIVTINNPTIQTSYNGFSSAIIPCAAGDEFQIAGLGGENARLWMFVDSSNNVLSSAVSRQEETVPVTIVAPANAVKLIVNNEDVSADIVFVKKSIIKNDLRKAEANILNICDNGSVEIVKNITWKTGYVTGNTGEIKTSSTAKFSNPIILKANETVTITIKADNVAAISKTTSSNVNIGDVVTPIFATSYDGEKKTYSYTALFDEKIVLCTKFTEDHEVRFTRRINDFYEFTPDTNYVCGSYNSLYIFNYKTDRVRFEKTIPVFAGEIVVVNKPSGFNASIGLVRNGSEVISEGFDNLSYKHITEDCGLCVVWKRTNNEDLTPNDIYNSTASVKILSPDYIATKRYSEIENNSRSSIIPCNVLGGYSMATNFSQESNRRRMESRVLLKAGDTAHITVNSGYAANYSLWSLNGNNTLGYDITWNCTEYTNHDIDVKVDTDCYLFVIGKKSDNSDFTDGEVPAVVSLGFEINQKNIIKKYDNSLFTEAGEICAHRCMPYAQNTIIGTKKCITEHKIRVHEFDIAFTSDNVPVLLHDTTINNTARNADGSQISETINISDITYSEALEYDFGIKYGSEYAGEKIAKLEDALILLSNNKCICYLDLLGHDYTGAQLEIIADLIKTTNMAGKVGINAQESKLDRFCVLADPYTFVPNPTQAIRGDIDRLYHKYSRFSDVLVFGGNGTVTPSYPDFTRSEIAALNRLGITTLVADVTTVERAKQLFALGVNQILSNNLGRDDVDFNE